MELTTTFIIGQFAIAGTGMYLDSRNSGGRIKNARELFFSGIHDDLIHSVEISTTLQEEWLQKERIERATLNKLKRCALTYRHNQELVELLYEHEHGEHIFNHFHEINEIIGDMEHDQGCLDEIEDAFNDKLYQLKLHNPEISVDDAVESVISALDSAHKQFYRGLRKSMDASIKHLVELTQRALELDKELH